MSKIDVTFVTNGRKAQCAPNPAHPNGIDVDLAHGAKSACLANLPYPAECCGILIARCKTCGASAAITTAGRPDDPRTVTLACKRASSSPAS
ncbi:hypothetical protein ABIB86_000384 [Bradyrhizobium sp. JR1.7]